MNKDRRKLIEKARGMMEEAQALLAQAAEEEQEYYDNMPENMQSSERGDKASSDAEALQQAADDVENAVSNLGDVIDG